MIDKPSFRSPCNNCGRCCELEICHIGEIAFPGASAPCPGILTQPDGRKLCGIVLLEKSTRLMPQIQFSLGIGSGCSMPDDETTEQEIAEFDVLSLIKARELHPQHI